MPNGSNPADPAAPRDLLPPQFVLLEDVCRRLGVSRQGLVNLLRESSIPIERIRRGGRTLSGIDHLDFARLKPSDPARQPPPAHSLWAQLRDQESIKDLELAGTREELRRTRVQLAEARADLEVAERSVVQLERVTAEAGASQETIIGLNRDLGHLGTSLENARSSLEMRDKELAALRKRCQQERERLFAELEVARSQGAAVRAEFEETRALREAAECQLHLAAQVEAANGMYLDRMEEKLLAARHTARFLRKKRA